MGLLNIFESKEKMERLSHMKYVLMMAFADGKLENSEIELLNMISERLELNPDEFKRLLEKPDSVKLRTPESRIARLEILCDIALLMMVDKDIDQSEVQLLLGAAANLGFNSDIALNIVESIIEAVKQEKPTERTARELDSQLG